jgi:hypothetical protein
MEYSHVIYIPTITVLFSGCADLLSGTKNVSWYTTTVHGTPFSVLDTPKFDDIALSDSTILQDLATELASIYDSQRHLAGLIYLHDISKVRMGRVSYKVSARR